MAENNRRSAEKARQLTDLLRDRKSLLVVMQDHPDPDSIAAAAALRRFAREVSEARCSLAHGGTVGRVENRELVDYLGLNFRPMNGMDLSRFDTVALVDTQPNTGNNSLGPDRLPDIVIDHHRLRSDTRKVAFHDVRPQYGAVATILHEYLEQVGIEPDAPLATAMLYAIRTDTQDLGLEAIRADVEATLKLYQRANTRVLSAIQRGGVERDYFQLLATALVRARQFGPAILVRFDDLDNPDILGETADLLLRLREASWVMCFGIHAAMAWVSVRTSQTERKAAEVVQEMARDLGTGGGHEMSGGAQIPLQRDSAKQRDAVWKEVRERFVRAIGVENSRPRPLVKV